MAQPGMTPAQRLHADFIAEIERIDKKWTDALQTLNARLGQAEQELAERRAREEALAGTLALLKKNFADAARIRGVLAKAEDPGAAAQKKEAAKNAIP